MVLAMMIFDSSLLRGHSNRQRLRSEQRHRGYATQNLGFHSRVLLACHLPHSLAEADSRSGEALSQCVGSYIDLTFV